MEKNPKEGKKNNKRTEKEAMSQLQKMMKDIFTGNKGLKEITNLCKGVNRYLSIMGKKNKKIYKQVYRPYPLAGMIKTPGVNSDVQEFEDFATSVSCYLEANANLNSNPTSSIAGLMAIDSVTKNQNLQKKSPEKLKKFQDCLKMEAMLIWSKIPTSIIEKFTYSYKISKKGSLTQKQLSPIADMVEDLLHDQRYKAAADYILCFNLEDEFDLESLIETLTKRDMASIAVRLAEKTNDLQIIEKTIKKLDYFKDKKLATTLIRKYKLDHSKFKKLVEHQIYGSIRSFVKRHDWMKAEEISAHNGVVNLNILVKVLIKNKQYSEAYSVVQRHSDKIYDYVLRSLQNKCRKPDLAVNSLLHENYYGPTEVFLGNGKEEEYLLMADFGFPKLSDVHFLDGSNAQLMQDVMQRLLNAESVGADCEFKSRPTNFDGMEAATLQLATKDLSCIFDCNALQHNEDFKKFLLEFFSNPKIEKIGHSFGGDISALNHKFDVSLIFTNIVNIEKLYMNGKQVRGLAKIVELVYNKKLSKYNQESAWDQRPLRPGQIHYGALDAVSVLDILMKYREAGGEAVENSKGQDYCEIKDEAKMSRKNGAEFIQNEELLKKYIQESHHKFLADTMLEKLGTLMRNIGIDTEICDHNSTPSEKSRLAEETERVLLTRSKNLMMTKKTCPMIKLISTKPMEQLKQVMTKMKIPLDKSKILSRCVKCNYHELTVIEKPEAMETLKWENADSREDTVFYKCEGCKQIYWEGGMFEKAKKNFESIEAWGIEGVVPKADVVEKATEPVVKQEAPAQAVGEGEGEAKSVEGYLGIDGLTSEIYALVREKIQDELRQEIRLEVLRELHGKLKDMGLE